MLRIDRILCPVDFSPFSKRGLEHAAVLARWYGSQVTALHVTPLMPTVFGFPSPVATAALEPATSEAVLRELTGFVAGVAEAAPAAAAPTAVLRSGPPAAEILKYAAEQGSDLVVLGTHGRTGFEHFMLGSVTEKVVRKAPCPVLTVPRHVEGRPERPTFERIVCGADFSPASDRAVGYALSLAQESNGRLMLLHVLDGLPDKSFTKYPQFDVDAYRRFATTEARHRLEALVPEEARAWCEPDLRIACGKPYQQILRLAANEGADLIALGVHGEGPIDRMLFGSTAHHIVRQAECPVLTMRA